VCDAWGERGQQQRQQNVLAHLTIDPMQHAASVTAHRTAHRLLQDPRFIAGANG
jgi:hypothetical protein